VVNDAIILIDRIVKNIARLERHIGHTQGTAAATVDSRGEPCAHPVPTKEEYLDALVSASKSRLQPIIVTTLTTLF